LHGVLRLGVRRVICFFGMLPNFESEFVFPRLAQVAGPGDVLLVSANLAPSPENRAPGPAYLAGVLQVLPQYDNDLTREWLLTSLLNAGIGREDGTLSVGIEEHPLNSGLLRIKVDFRFIAARTIRCEGEEFSFAEGELFQLFFSYRHTPEILAALFRGQGMRVADAWMTQAGDEGVFRVAKATG